MSESLKAQRERLAEDAFERVVALYEAMEPQEAVGVIVAAMRELQKAAIVATAGELGYEIEDTGRFLMSMRALTMHPDPIAMLDADE
jgi:hypothetical protein